MRGAKPSRIAIGVVAAALVGAACSTDPAPAPSSTVPVASTSTTSSTPSTTTTTASTTTTTAPTTTTTLAPLQGLAYEVITEDLTQPVLVRGLEGSDVLYVVERPGRVRRMLPDGSLEPYLDITDRVAERGIEQGLHGLAFHPEFAENGRLFAYYVAREDDDGRLVEYRADPDAADPSTERVLATFDQAIIRHYGGMVTFGPDGYLWLSLGEGGAASVHAQDPDTPLGALLRIDVDGGDPYAVPADNPFVEGGAPEVWAYGLRNPWRFAIDAVERMVYIADVGHERWEEIDVVSLDQPGANFGWLRMEGPDCFQSGCDPEEEGLTLPAHAYTHEEGCSITGGFVYRGAAIPELEGQFLFSDWCQGWLRSYDHATGQVTDWTDDVGVIGQVNGFGEDPEGELYVLTWEGAVAKLVAER